MRTERWEAYLHVLDMLVNDDNCCEGQRQSIGFGTYICDNFGLVRADSDKIATPSRDFLAHFLFLRIAEMMGIMSLNRQRLSFQELAWTSPQ